MKELTASGIVISNNANKARVQIEAVRACQCDHQGCPWKAPFEDFHKEKFVVDAENSAGAKPGFRVEIKTSSKDFLKAMFLIYLSPLVGLFAGCVTGLKVASLFDLPDYSNVLAGLFAAVGLILALLLMKKAGKSCNPRYVVTRILNSEAPCCFSIFCIGGKL